MLTFPIGWADVNWDHMAKPILLAVAEDADLLEILTRDLDRECGTTCRVLRASSGQAALDLLTRAREHQEVVALLVSSQHMTGITGADLLAQSRQFFPDARRVLLVDRAETMAELEASNPTDIHFCLIGPGDPPEEKLYPMLDDLLDDWRAGYHLTIHGLRVLGRRWSLRDHKMRNFLARNHVPFCWMELDGNDASHRLLSEFKLGTDKTPVLIFSDGSLLIDPELDVLAAHVGLSTQAAQDFYDLVVIGAGPAGLAAAVYGASEGLRTLLIEPMAPGGQAGSTSRIENYLGFPSGITGADLGRRARRQAVRLGAEFITQQATGLRIDGPSRYVRMADGREVSTQVVLLATGVQYRTLDIPGAGKLTGRGIYYGAALVEAASCSGEEVYVVGGANSAGQAAIHFANYACKVVMLVRRPGLAATMSKYLIDEIEQTPNIELKCDTQVIRAFGDEQLEAMLLCGPEGEYRVPATSLFVFIGAEPSTEWLPPCILRDEFGYLLAGPDLRADGKLPASWQELREPYLLESSVPGVFVAGDVRHGSIKRVSSAVGEGSIAVNFVHQYLAGI